MNRNTYQKPMMVVVEVGMEQLIAASLEITDEKANPDYGILSNEQRGSWGDLWSE